MNIRNMGHQLALNALAGCAPPRDRLVEYLCLPSEYLCLPSEAAPLVIEVALEMLPELVARARERLEELGNIHCGGDDGRATGAICEAPEADTEVGSTETTLGEEAGSASEGTADGGVGVADRRELTTR